MEPYFKPKRCNMMAKDLEGNILKIKFILLFVLLITTVNASTSKYILKHDGLIDPRAQEKINQIGLEAQSKLKTNIYLYIIENNGIKMKSGENRADEFRKFEDNIVKTINTKNNYVLLIISINQTFINIRLSKNLENIINKKDIIYEYIVPLLASKDKNTLFAKTSAACLNGYGQIADSIAEHQNIKLESSIGSVGKTAGTIWKVMMYSLVVFGIGAYTVIIMKQRKA